MKRERRRVDIICLCNSHGIGGAQLNAGMLAHQFERRGYRASLGFLFEREPDSFHGHADFFTVSDEFPSGPFAWIRFLLRCLGELATRKPRVIIGFQPASNVIASLAALVIPRCAVIATQRNPSSFQSMRGRLLDRTLGALGLYRANIAVSQTVADSYSGYPGTYLRRLRVIHNATPPLAAVDETQAVCRRRFGMPPGRRILGCVGRLHPQKNFLLAINAHARLPDDVHLYIAGEGPERAHLEDAASRYGTSSRVHFLGALSGADLTRFYRSLDVLLFTSIYEGFGRVLVEALSQGTPVISNDIPIAREVAADAATFCSADIETWRDEILQLLDDENRRDSLKTRGQERASHFAMEAMVSSYLLAAGLPVDGADKPTS